MFSGYAGRFARMTVHPSAEGIAGVYLGKVRGATFVATVGPPVEPAGFTVG